MRIAMVGVRGIPARTGGAERVVEQLARQLVLRGHEVLIYCRHGMVNGIGTREEGIGTREQGRGKRGEGRGETEEGRGKREGENGNGNGNGNGTGNGNGHDPVRIFTPYWPGKHLEAFTHTASAVFDALRRHVDVVHVHSPGPALLSWLPILAGKPLVLTVHAADWQREKWHPAAQAVLRGGLWCGMHCADAVTAVSPSLADELEREFARPVRFVPNAVEPAQPEPVRMLPHWGLQSGRYLLHVGRLVPEKRLDLLLRCWPQSNPQSAIRNPQSGGWKLAVAGEYDESPYGRACRASGGQNVIFLGPRYGRELAELYSHAGAVVQPGVLEGMSLVLLEAASYGRCVVAADIPANREALGEAALYVRPDDAAELAGAIGRCVECEGLRRELGARALERSRQLPSWAAVAEIMERIYQAAIRAEAG